ncbi:MAG TPA: carboxypeptidase-like regulatory domain-containing protein, partial [Gemmatimonadales bacterium]
MAAVFALLTASSLAAQQGAVITGRVTTEQGEPLGGASIVVGNTNLGAVTAANGTYTITIGADAARGQEVVLTARYIGRKPVSRTITIAPGEQEQNFQLASDPLRLDEVVVTGVGEATARKKLSFTVGVVNDSQLHAVPGSSALVALEGKVAAVRLV